MSKERIISGIDVGSSKIATIIAQISDEEQVSIIGVSSVPSRGIKKGVVVDIDEAVEAISECLEGAERMAGYAVSTAFVTVDGVHISSVNSSGVVAVSSPDAEIGKSDIERVTEAARAISIPSSREILHVLPRTFSIDNQEGVDDPIGMSGIRLQVETHIITGAASSMRNLAKCVNQVGVDIEDLVFDGLASAEATLSDTEKELGVILVDIGGGTTKVILFVEGSPAYSCVLPVGGKNITNDIAIGLRISLEDAEKVKQFISEYRPPTVPEDRKPATPLRQGYGGQAAETRRKKDEEDEIDISDLGIAELHTVDKKFLQDGVIKPRLEEIFEEVASQVRKSGFEGQTPSGLVICGGAAQTIGLSSVAKRILRLPLRIGQPTSVSGLIDEVSSPAYAASIGTILFGMHAASERKLPLVSGLPIGKVKDKVKKTVDWIKSFMP